MDSFVLNHSPSLWARTGLEDQYCEKLPEELAMPSRQFFIPAQTLDKSPSLVLRAYHLKKSVYEEAARSAGFVGELEWQKCDLSQ